MTEIYEALMRDRPVLLNVTGGEFSTKVFSTSSNTAAQVAIGATGTEQMLQPDSTGRDSAVSGVIVHQVSGVVPFGVTASAGVVPFGVTVRSESTHGAVNVVPFTSAPLFTAGTSEPKIPGTDIPLYRISALLDGGMRVAEVMEDFPSLNADQIIWARDYARQNPNFGRPYPNKSLKRLLRNSGFAELERTLRRRKKRS